MAIISRFVNLDRLLGGEAKRQEGHGDAVVALRRDARPAADLAAAEDAQTNRRRPAPSTPQAVKPATIAPSRSLSLTRSSARPSITLSPSAKAQAIGQRRDFVDHRRDLFGADVAGPKRPNGEPDVGDDFAGLDALIRQLDVRAHRFQRLVQARSAAD